MPLHKEELHADGRFWLFSTNKACLASASSPTCSSLAAHCAKGPAVLTHMAAGGLPDTCLHVQPPTQVLLLCALESFYYIYVVSFREKPLE